MSINSAPPSSSDNTATSSKNSPQSKANRSIQSLVAYFKGKFSISRPKPIANSHNAATAGTDDDQGGAAALANLIRQDLAFMSNAIAEVENYVDHLKVQINSASHNLGKLEAGGSNRELELEELKKIAAKLKSQVPSNLEIHPADEPEEELETRAGSDRELHELKRNVAKLKSQIASNLKVRSVDSNPHLIVLSDGFPSSSSNQADENKGRHGSIPSLYEDLRLEHPTAFEHLKESFLGLPFTLKYCLLCFLRFPEKAILKKTLVIYWWIGEGILPPIPMDPTREEENGSGKTAEDFGEEFLDVLIAKGFIEPVFSKSSFTSDSCGMRALVRSVLTFVAEKVGFSSIQTLGPDSQILGPAESQYLLNVGATVIDCGPEPFTKMEHIKILYLGRWQSSASQHIELEDTTILYELKHMNQLRFLSLRGISMITQLPWIISQLSNLNILDLRACHNLEMIPDEIGLLTNLTHLDMSECYYLEHMPKGLALLFNLQVLKGFFIGDSKSSKQSCSLADLAAIPALRKLNIYTCVEEFPTEEHLRALEQFKELKKLTISWGGCSTHKEAKDEAVSLTTEVKIPRTEGQCKNEAKSTGGARPSVTRSFTLKQQNNEGPRLPSTLQKLDLQCFRKTITQTWLKPGNLKNLKKLYIRGGKFRDLGQFQKEDQWGVEILRLKYLSELEMDWIELRRLFPKLLYLEQVQCPKLYFFLCDKNGVWMERTTKINQL